MLNKGLSQPAHKASVVTLSSHMFAQMPVVEMFIYALHEWQRHFSVYLSK